jgi:hypothetical protein
LQHDPDPYVQREARWALNKLQPRALAISGVDSGEVRPGEVAASTASGTGIPAGLQSTQPVHVVPMIPRARAATGAPQARRTDVIGR